MEIHKKFFPEVMRENDLAYFAHLEGLIESVDEYSSMQITKSGESYIFRIAPSMPKYGESLLQEILKLHTMFKIRLDLSKSIKSSGTIVFRINLFDD
jgi:hypothetical protein|tara:strand:- start:22 stop:312 length:291 start_codon:yes stop_codon:yes gene_type:complete